jgi:hypothetical protein
MLEREIWQSYNSKIFYAICLPIKKKKNIFYAVLFIKEKRFCILFHFVYVDILVRDE